MPRPQPAPQKPNPTQFATTRCWALWCLRELARLRVYHALGPQAHALVTLGYLDQDEATRLLCELRGVPPPPKPAPKQLDLLHDIPPAPNEENR